MPFHVFARAIATHYPVATELPKMEWTQIIYGEFKRLLDLHRNDPFVTFPQKQPSSLSGQTCVR